MGEGEYIYIILVESLQSSRQAYWKKYFFGDSSQQIFFKFYFFLYSIGIVFLSFRAPGESHILRFLVTIEDKMP